MLSYAVCPSTSVFILRAFMLSVIRPSVILLRCHGTFKIMSRMIIQNFQLIIHFCIIDQRNMNICCQTFKKRFIFVAHATDK